MLILKTSSSNAFIVPWFQTLSWTRFGDQEIPSPDVLANSNFFSVFGHGWFLRKTKEDCVSALFVSVSNSNMCGRFRHLQRKVARMFIG